VRPAKVVYTNRVDVRKLLGVYRSSLERLAHGAGPTAVYLKMLRSVNRVSDLLDADRVVEACCLLGWVRHEMCQRHVFSETELDAHMQSDLPPEVLPAGTAAVPVAFSLDFVCRVCQRAVLPFHRRGQLPAGVPWDEFHFPGLSGNRRLMEVLGVDLIGSLDYTSLDLSDGATCVFLEPFLLRPNLDEEAVALLVGIFREHGWGFAFAGWEWKKEYAAHAECAVEAEEEAEAADAAAASEALAGLEEEFDDLEDELDDDLEEDN
jgi:hypothetical protein